VTAAGRPRGEARGARGNSEGKERRVGANRGGGRGWSATRVRHSCAESCRR
jgi:hypothetical protein